MEEQVYQGYLYRRNSPAEDWVRVGPAPGGAVVRPVDQYAANKEARAAQDQEFQSTTTAIAERGDSRSEQKSRIDNAQALRKEYSSLPEVRSFKVATQMASSALNTADNPQGDIALTYAFAKAMDPESVVRDQENRMVTNSQPWFQSAVENIKKQFGMDGAGNFTPEARARLREEVIKVVATRKPLYEARRREMGFLAQEYGIKPEQIIGEDDIKAFAPAFREYAVKHGDPNGVVAGFLGEPIPQPDTLRSAPAGSQTQALKIPPEMQREHDAYLRQNWGRLDPQAYSAFRVGLDQKYGFGSNPEGYAASVDAMNRDAAAGRLPEGMVIPPVEADMSGLDVMRNDAVNNPYGAAVAGALNAGGFGIPGALAPDQWGAIQEENYWPALGGEIAGGVAGTGLMGGLLRGAAGRTGIEALATPLAADIGYGATYGATQGEDPLYGAVGGAAGGLIGNRLGGFIGGNFPGTVGYGGAVRRLDESVPTSRQLRDKASALYKQAENTGEVIGPNETLALRDRVYDLLHNEGRVTPAGRLTEVLPKVRELANLVNDYADKPMTAKEFQAVRGVAGDAVTSGDNAERRIARMLLGEVDDWADAATPQMGGYLRDARKVASRYLQGDDIALARELADVRAGQFSNAGRGNALRTDFRQLDRNIAKGNQSFSPAVEEAISNVARGDQATNLFRNIGRFAPTGAMSALPSLGVGGIGLASMGPVGLALGAGFAGATHGSRAIGQRMTDRAAQIAENLAYAGPEYGQHLAQIVSDARGRGGNIASGASAPTTSDIINLLLTYGDEEPEAVAYAPQ